MKKEDSTRIIAIVALFFAVMALTISFALLNTYFTSSNDDTISVEKN